MRDNVDCRLDQWRAERPDIDPSPMGIIGRIQRASHILEKRLSEHFATHDLQLWEFDVLATLRRAGAPYRLTTGALVQASMRTSGAITHRLDRLVERGLVEREVDSTNRRSVLVTLSPTGLALIDEIIVDHVNLEVELLAGMSEAEQLRIAALLRKLLITLGDAAPD